jgi:hypothetical protein
MDNQTQARISRAPDPAICFYASFAIHYRQPEFVNTTLEVFNMKLMAGSSK